MSGDLQYPRIDSFGGCWITMRWSYSILLPTGFNIWQRLLPCARVSWGSIPTSIYGGTSSPSVYRRGGLGGRRSMCRWAVSHPILQSKTRYSYMCAQDVQTHTYITNCSSIKVKYLLHRISHHKINTKFARWQYYYNHSGITSPTAIGTPTGERLPSSPEHPPGTLHIHYLLPIRDFSLDVKQV